MQSCPYIVLKITLKDVLKVAIDVVLEFVLDVVHDVVLNAVLDGVVLKSVFKAFMVTATHCGYSQNGNTRRYELFGCSSIAVLNSSPRKNYG